MWYVYLLRCADDTLYAGCTNDPPRRLQQHNAGRAPSIPASAVRSPWSIWSRPGITVRPCAGRPP